MKKPTSKKKKNVTLDTLSRQIETGINQLAVATSKGFQKMEDRFDASDKRMDALEKRAHGTELGINEIKALHGKKIKELEEDMISFRVALTKANIIKPKMTFTK